MPFTLIGWQESEDEASVLLPKKACSDTHVTVSGDIIYVPKLNKLLAEYVQGSATGRYAQLRSPSLRAKVLQDLAPISLAATTPNPVCFLPHFSNPINLVEGEGLEALYDQTTAAAAVKTILAWLGDGPLSPITGEIMSVRVTATITSVLSDWVNGTLTFSQTLPRGRYALVGAAFWEADLLAVRFCPVGEFWRPGCLGSATIGIEESQYFRYGRIGKWFEFDSLTPPSIEILNFAAASQSITGVLDLIKVA